MKLAIVYGGRSGEHEVSCKSAHSILAHLDRGRYDVTEVLIGRDGAWHVDGLPVGMGDALRTLGRADVVFPALHGPYGEDGTVQSLLELAGVPYVGSGVLASATGMDKEFTKKILAADGLRVADGAVLRPGTDELSPADRDRLGLPVFVKPARAGSSIGVTRVDDWAALPAALDAARACDGKVLVEAGVTGREVDVAVLQFPDGSLRAGPPLEIRVTDGHGFFDYDAKYTAGEVVFDIPARLDAAVTSRLQELAIQAFTALDCRGLLRVDFFLPADGGEPVLNEVNTFPGFTSASQYPRMWQAAGMSYPELLDTLIATALASAARHLTALSRR
ncbi:D-alanine--D-alanine ligase family protein [Catellatospora bangladeshensis]|uniref:D-alanine--D-alanine ligase n=1 Tax=Catellatospora bangladeshensis TaxID=310355 RepID=A0A8J3JXM9_9ACTN|nr:D-alanine--D-alanine ligase family protein [Catellatospora bangladeshensis]GIF84969.1 D-alanine--D-alanine ligase [Catellatospora bangladeshensis]